MNITQLIKNKTRLSIDKIKLLEENYIKINNSNNININNYLISVYDNLELFHYVKPISEIQNIIKDIILNKNIIIMGKFLLNIFLENNLFNNNNIYLFNYKKNIINQLDIKLPNIIIDNQIYDNLIYVILKQSNWIDRIAYFNNKIYVSNLFILEYLEKYKYINNFDPIINKKYLIFNDIKEDNLHQLISSYNFYEILNMNKNNKVIYFEEFRDFMTPIERALLLLSKENNYKLKLELKNIILLLSKYSYLRHPCLYFNYLMNINNINFDLDIKTIIYSINSKINIVQNKIINIQNDENGINKYIISNLIESDLEEYFIEYINTFNYILNINDFNLIIKYNSRKILKLLIINNILNKEYLDMIELLKVDNNMIINKFKSMIKEIIINNKYISFYYVYKLDNTIINHKLLDNSIIHEISNNSLEILKLIIKLDNNIVNIINNKKQNILMTNIDKNIDIIIILLQYINLIDSDIDNNTILHYLVKFNRIDVINYMLSNKCLHNYIISNLNLQNNNNETPLIISTINNNENLFYILYNLGSNTELKDIHENTIYHYICKNKMCIGMKLKNEINKYGFNSWDYADISKDYWIWN